MSNKDNKVNPSVPVEANYPERHFMDKLASCPHCKREKAKTEAGAHIVEGLIVNGLTDPRLRPSQPQDVHTKIESLQQQLRVTQEHVAVLEDAVAELRGDSQKVYAVKKTTSDPVTNAASDFLQDLQQSLLLVR